MSNNYLKYLKYKTKYTKLLFSIGGGFDKLPLELTTLIANFYPALLIANKEILIKFFDSYIPSIPDIELIAQMIDSELPDNIFNNISTCKFVKDQQKCKLFFIEMQVKSLLKKLAIDLKKDLEVLNVLGQNLPKNYLPLSFYIICPGILKDNKYKLLATKSSKEDLTTYSKQFVALYTQNSELIDKLLARGFSLENINQFGQQLIGLYTQNKALIDKLLIRTNYGEYIDSLQNITNFGEKLIELYTQNKALIDKLLTSGDSLPDIVPYCQRIIELYTSGNKELIDKLLAECRSLSTIINYYDGITELYKLANRELIDELLKKIEELPKLINRVNFIKLYINNKELIDKLLAEQYSVQEINNYGEQLIALYTAENKALIDKLLANKVDLYVIISRDGEQLIALYTEKNKKIIDELLATKKPLNEIIDCFK